VLAGRCLDCRNSCDREWAGINLLPFLHESLFKAVFEKAGFREATRRIF
jgi:hypothetical protein